MAGAAVNDTANRRHIGKVAPLRQRHVVFAWAMPTGAVVGGVQVAPARAGRQVGHIDRYPGVRGVAANQTLGAGRGLRQQITADVTGRHAHSAQAGNHDVGKVLAHALTLGQRLQGRGVHLGALALVGEVGVDALHQVLRGGQQRGAGGKTGAGVGGKVGVTRHKGRGKHKFAGGIKARAGYITHQLTGALPGDGAVWQRPRLGGHHTVRHHLQRAVRALQGEKAAAVAKHIKRQAALRRQGADAEGVFQQLLVGAAQRLQVGHVLRGLYGGHIVVTRFVGDLQLHQVPRLWFDSSEWVK